MTKKHYWDNERLQCSLMQGDLGVALPLQQVIGNVFLGKLTEYYLMAGNRAQ